MKRDSHKCTITGAGRPQVTADTLMIFDNGCQFWQRNCVLGRRGFGGPRRPTALEVDDFRRALADGEIVLHYQPQVDLRTATFRGAEALIRWDHPDGGLLPPADFLPVLTHSELMPVITEWVIRTACAQAAARPHLCVAVNIAATDACDPALVDAARAALADTKLQPERLTLELTEDALVQDIDRATRNLRQLADDGVTISLDDFGTGYSSMLYLRELPITELKIDQVFTAGIGRDPDDEAIVAGLVRLGHAVGVKVVAEGVETQTQADQLVELGCDYAQGFLYGRPVSRFPHRGAVPHTDKRHRRPRDHDQRAPKATAEAQNLIRSLVSDGASLHSIAAALNRHGTKRNDGSRWSASSVGRVIDVLYADDDD